MRVLVVTNMYPSSGTQKGVFVKESVAELRRDPRVQSVDVFNIDDFLWAGVFKYLLSFPKLARVLFRSKYEIVHVHFGLSFLPVFPVLPIIKMKKTSLVATFHGSDLMGGATYNIISNICAVFSSRVILVSRHMSDYVWKVSRPKCLVVPCGVNHRLFRYIDRDKWSPEQPLNIIFPSDPTRLEKNYGVFNLIINALSEKHIVANVTVFKSLNRKEVFDRYSQAHLMVLSSLREGSPQVVKEALLTGLPIVSTRVGDVEEVLGGVDNVCFFERPEQVLDWVMNDFRGGSIDKGIVAVKKDRYSLGAINNVLVAEYTKLCR